MFKHLKEDYSSEIEGRKDKEALGNVVLNYHWNGTYSYVGLIFIEVAGTSKEWTDYYNAN